MLGATASRPAGVSPDGTYGRALLPPSTIMSHILEGFRAFLNNTGVNLGNNAADHPPLVT